MAEIRPTRATMVPKIMPAICTVLIINRVYECQTVVLTALPYG